MASDGARASSPFAPRHAPLFHLPLHERADEGAERQLGQVEEALLALRADRQQGQHREDQCERDGRQRQAGEPELGEGPGESAQAGEADILVDRFRFTFLNQGRQQRVVVRRDGIFRARSGGDDELVADIAAGDRRDEQQRGAAKYSASNSDERARSLDVPKSKLHVGRLSGEQMDQIVGEKISSSNATKDDERDRERQFRAVQDQRVDRRSWDSRSQRCGARLPPRRPSSCHPWCAPRTRDAPGRRQRRQPAWRQP